MYSDQPDSQEKLRVLYVVGAGRSGSTVASAVLGAHPLAAYAGEIGYTPFRGWEGDRLCSCGERWDECGYWTKVREEVDAELNGFDLERYRNLQRLFEPYLMDWRGWLRLAKEKRSSSRSAMFAEYSQMMLSVLRAVAATSRSKVVVDSSKDPGRAMALSLVPEIELVVVHVVRDPRGVAYSMAKAFGKDASKAIYHSDPGSPVLRSSALWTLTNALSELAGRVGADRFVRIRYEDLMADPGKELQRVGDVAGLDYSDVARAIVAGEPIPTGHLLNGNRMRMSQVVRLRTDEEWKSALSSKDKLRVRSLSEPMLRFYGYK